ncbi:MAG TPA: ABC transporter ATP-binding protein [Spirochaetota bacterium]|nr:ABC transporter ATP-binding protein [Spirochaetota bacterium]HRZ25970.1 ABC transporter ATP-binding protein [Spirochaetota bacterium]HSA14252.1 ABC transporter ATP-binding protein [Spirochaetota bacterium]
MTEKENHGTNAILKIEGVSAGFGKREILSDVSLSVMPARIMAITGKSGSGKSTLLGILSGLLEPQSGRVLYNDDDILKWFDFKRSRFRNRHIGFIFQFFNLLPDMTAYQNILYPSALNVFSKDRRGDAEYLIRQMGLETIRNQYPSTLSGGELQRVAIARAIINKPKIVLADEPTGNLDEATANGIIDLFFEIKERYGISFVIVTHDHRIVERADVHYHLEDGRLSLISGKGSAGLRRFAQSGITTAAPKTKVAKKTAAKKTPAKKASPKKNSARKKIRK